MSFEAFSSDLAFTEFLAKCSPVKVAFESPDRTVWSWERIRAAIYDADTERLRTQLRLTRLADVHERERSEPTKGTN